MRAALNACVSGLGDRNEACSCASDGGFPKLPLDILLRIAGKLTMKEWLRGAARACQSLYRMPLPSTVLVLNDDRVRSLPFPPIIHHDIGCGMTTDIRNMSGRHEGEWHLYLWHVPVHAS